jgi:hypothetical protein
MSGSALPYAAASACAGNKVCVVEFRSPSLLYVCGRLQLFFVAVSSRALVVSHLCMKAACCIRAVVLACVRVRVCSLAVTDTQVIPWQGSAHVLPRSLGHLK